MASLRLIPSDGADWTIDAVPEADGIALVVTFPLHGDPVTVRFGMERADARTLSDGILKASGDGTQRSFPHPPAEGCDHG